MLVKLFAAQLFIEQCPRGVSRRFRNPGQSCKSFTSSAACRAKSSSATISKPTLAQTSLKFAGQRPEGFAVLERKVARHGSVLLFKSPSHRAYYFSAYTLAATAFAASVYTSYSTFQNPMIPLQTWHKLANGTAAVLMSTMGALVIIRTFGFVRSVTAIKSNGVTVIRFTVDRMIPLMKPRVFDSVPRQIVFSRRLVLVPNKPDLTPKKEPLAFTTFFTIRVKKVSSFLWRLFRATRQVFTNEDCLMIDVEGQGNSFKMDINGYLSNDLLRIGQPVDLQR